MPLEFYAYRMKFVWLLLKPMTAQEFRLAARSRKRFPLIRCFMEHLAIEL